MDVARMNECNTVGHTAEFSPTNKEMPRSSNKLGENTLGNYSEQKEPFQPKAAFPPKSGSKASGECDSGVAVAKRTSVRESRH